MIQWNSSAEHGQDTPIFPHALSTLARIIQWNVQHEARSSKLEEQKKKAEEVTAVFSSQYDLSTSQGLLAFQAANPNAFIGAGPDYFKTHTLQQAIADGVVKLNERLPGFAKGVENFEGGPAIVGENEPEIVNLPRGANVIPFSKLGAGGVSKTSVSIGINVSGVFDPASQQQLKRTIGDAIMTEVLAARRV